VYFKFEIYNNFLGEIKVTKLLLISAMVLLVQNMAYADEERGTGKRFEQKKDRILENIGKKIKFLNNFKTCITTASSREELKSCRMTNKKIMEEFRATKKASKEERKQLRAARKEEREKRRTERE
jgi:hypothetical protein